MRPNLVQLARFAVAVDAVVADALLVQVVRVTPHDYRRT